jgi:pimeloyl-ACP methyl ester carboxylesterase
MPPASGAWPWASCHTPPLVVGGLHDAMFRPDAVRDGIAAPPPNARVELLDCGHDVPIERPRELAALIETFLAEVGQAPARAAFPR